MADDKRSKQVKRTPVARPKKKTKKKLKVRRERASAAAASPTPRGDTAPRTSAGPDPSPPAEPATAAARPVERERERERVFPIIGIGASAGGLEALEEFLEHVPLNPGVAYVVIQHLDPTQKDMLVELLQRATTMRVVRVTDNLSVEPNHCYVIPAGQDMSLMHGVLHLIPQVVPRGFSLPIDFFFRSLAADQQERSIAVVLSGMGSDGTLGVRAIKERGGAAFVQSIESAKFDGMPRSVIDAGLADVIAPVAELPARIQAYRTHVPYFGQRDVVEVKVQSSLDKVFALLRAQTGNDFSLYKRSTIQRRIERRLGLHQIDSIAHYVRYLRENPGEIELLFKELLIGVTNFFRDPPAWEYLKQEVLPKMLASRPGGGVLRAWVPGCSTGEEAYSLAIVFKEAMDGFKPIKNLSLQIFATDLDRDAIEKARQAMYPENIKSDVSAERLRRFFIQDERGFRVGKEIRETVVFAPQNVLSDPPFTKLDLLSCRNLLIYLSADLQKKLIPLFHYSLNPDGILFLGSAETIGGFSSLFHPLDGKSRIYRRLNSMATAPFEFPTAFLDVPTAAAEGEQDQLRPKTSPPNLERLVDRVLVQRFAPLGILCNDKGDILYVSGRAGTYFEPAVGKANLNIFAMAREGLRYELSSAFSAVVREGRQATRLGVTVGTNGGTRTVDLTVVRPAEPKELRGTVLVVVAETPATQVLPKRPGPRRIAESRRVAEVERELQRAREEAQTTREEMQTSQEELKSTNEELQSANEELQSTNEELTTSKEEMQSLNEELQTVNHELQSKVNELSHSNNDMKNLLNSTDIATLFLDDELRVRRFTTATAKIIKLMPRDAGRPITDITSDLDYPELADDAREVLRTLIFKEQQRSTRDNRWFTVRIMPYRTLENVIDGVVITFTDASAARALEASLREQADQLRQITESLPALVWVCRADGACDYLSRRWFEYTGSTEAELLGYGWLELIHSHDRERAREGWRDAVRTGADFESEFRIRGADKSYRWFQTRAVPIRDSRGAVARWYGTSVDVDVLKHSEDTRRRALDEFEVVLETITEGFFALDEDLTITAWNAAAEQLLGRPRAKVLGQNVLDALPGLRGTAFETNLTEALAKDAPVDFETQFESGSASFRVRLYPQRPSNRLLVVFGRS